VRASNSALDAEDQDQEETPIPGAHNYPPARLFYRFSSYTYTILFHGSANRSFLAALKQTVRGGEVGWKYLLCSNLHNLVVLY